MKKGRVPASVPAESHLRKQLRNPAVAAAYLTLAAEEEVPGDFLYALRKVIEAHGGIGSIAKKAKLNRQQLYKTLSREGNPEFLTLRAMLSAAGFALTVAPMGKHKARKSRARVVRNQKAGSRSAGKPADAVQAQ
jgi:probable addiction module antidote protein